MRKMTDPSVSAFAMYQKVIGKKRKNLCDNPKEKPGLPAKKLKKTTNKTNGSSDQNGFKFLGKKPPVNVQNKKRLVKKLSKQQFASNESESEEEIPTLVPISEKNLVKTQVKPKRNLTDRLSNRPEKEVDKAKPSAKPKSKKSKVSNIKEFNFKLEVPQSFNPVTQGLAIFKWLLDPIVPKDFFSKYWEKDVLYISRSDDNYFKDVFSTEKLDNILREFPLYFTRNVDVVTYESGKKEVFNPEGRAVPSQLWDYYLNGCSIRVLNPQTYDQNVHSIICSLQEYFGTMVGTNVYLTPPGSQGFAPHFDDIEAFIVQLEGSKHWKLYHPKKEDVLARDSSTNFKPEDLDKPFMEVTLNAGDVLYFPRGTIHEGRTKEDMHSLHITVSVYQHTAYADLLEHVLPDALKKAAKENMEFRKGLPLNYLKHVGLINQKRSSKSREAIIGKVKSLVETLVDYLDVDGAADRLGRKFMYDAMPPLYSQEEAQHSSKFDGDFMKNGRVFNRVEIDSDIKVRLLRYYAVRVVQESDGTVRLYYCTDNAKSYHGEEEQWLEIDSNLVPGIELLQTTYPEFIEVEKLPISDLSAKLQLISDLWERGLIVTEAPLPTTDSDESDSSEEELELVESASV